MRRPGTSKGLRIQGADGLMVRYAQCCQPVPGDPVIGIVKVVALVALMFAYGDYPHAATLSARLWLLLLASALIGIAFGPTVRSVPARSLNRTRETSLESRRD